jgi:phage gp29-like protein
MAPKTSRILDHLGRPVDTSQLTTELAAPSIFGVRQPFAPTVTSGLTPERLGAIIAAVDQGDAHDYLTLAEEMEERDLHYHSVLGTRKLAVGGLDVAVEAASDDPADVKISDAVTELTKCEEFTNLIADLLDALGKGYSVSEIMWDKSGSQWQPKCYEHRDPRFFLFNRFNGQELRLVDEKDPGFGIPLEPYKFIQHRPKIKTGLPIRGGLARLACVAFMCKSYTLRDWMTFAEVFGMPLRVGKYDSGATDNQKAALLRAVANIGSDASAIIPDTMQIEFVDAATSNGGDKLFQGLADWLDRQVSKGVLGQTMTSDSSSAGLGSNQADVHNDVREDIRDDDGRKLAATISRDLIRPFVDLNFGPQKKYPKLTLTEQKPEDLKLLSESLPPFINLGLKVQASVIRDKFGLQEPEDGAELLAPSVTASPFAIGPARPGSATPPPAPGNTSDTSSPLTPEDQSLAVAERKAKLLLMQRIVDGVELTQDQRAFLQLAAHGSPGDDEIDNMTADALDDWQQVMDPVMAPILAMANSATSLEGLLRDLKQAKPDVTAFTRSLAIKTFQARGLGDAKDEV